MLMMNNEWDPFQTVSVSEAEVESPTINNKPSSSQRLKHSEQAHKLQEK